jgi:hypothetical protein
VPLEVVWMPTMASVSQACLTRRFDGPVVPGVVPGLGDVQHPAGQLH